MLSYSQNFNNAIRATEREIRGYLQFNGDNTKVMRGNTGLISFTVHQDAMEEERFCIGSVCSSYCEASFFNEGIPAGVSLANSYFDAYLGVALQPPPNENTDYTVVPVVSNKTATITSGTYYLSTTSSEMSAFYGIANGGIVALTINGTTYETPMVYSSNRHEATVVDGTYTYSVYMTSSSNPLFFSAKNGTAWAAGTYTVSVEGRTYYMDYKCLGRFYITEISCGKQTTAVVAYDAVNRLSVDYVPTVTASTNGYKVLDILNDIVDQTGVNGGTHFTTTGASIYVPAIYAGTCKEQWGWLMTLCNSYGENSIGSRTDLGYIEQRAYENGKNNYTNYPALNDTVIYMDGIDAGNSFTINSLTTGTDEAPIVEGNGVGVNNYNPYIGSTQASAIFNNLDGITYTPMTIKFRGDPCIEVMDSLKVTQDGTDYRLVVMRITTTFDGGFSQELECWGDSEAYYAMSHGQMSVIESKVTTNSTMLKEIVESIETASNGVITKILDTDGSWKELVISNNQDLSQATSVWRWNINGLAHSTAYTGGTYSFALDDQGRIIASVIQTGILKDAANKNSWNLDTGELVTAKGKIGRFDITSTYLRTWFTEGDNTTCCGIGGNQAFWAGDNSSNSAPFRVSYTGDLVATNADITGKITASSGSIAGWSISATQLTKSTAVTSGTASTQYQAMIQSSNTPTDSAFLVRQREYDGTDYGSWTNNFRVRYNGQMYAKGATIEDGSISATYKKTYNYSDYSQTDLDTIQSIITNGTTPTAAQLEKYDIDGSGTLTMADLVKIRNMINNSENIVKTVTTVMNPSAMGQAIKATTKYTGAYSATVTAVLDGAKLTVPYVEGTESVTSNGGHFQYLYPYGANNYIKDFVYDYGTTSNWQWRKWNSGKCELWRTAYWSNKAFSAWGTVYVADIASQTLPFTFSAAPIVYATPAGRSDVSVASMWIIPAGGTTGATTTGTGDFQAVRPISGNATVGINYYVVGTLA